MRTARALSRYSPPVGVSADSDGEADEARLAAAVHEAYLLADELEQVLPPTHRGMAHRLRLTAEAAGSLHIVSVARRAAGNRLAPAPRSTP